MEDLTKLTKVKLIGRIAERDKHYVELQDELNICQRDLNRSREAHQATQKYASETSENLRTYIEANHSLKQRCETLSANLKAEEGLQRQMREFHLYLHTLLRDTASTAMPSVQAFVMQQVAGMLLAGPDTYNPSTYRVILFDCRGDGVHPSRIYCIKTVREMLNIGLKEAKEMTDPAYEVPPRPVILASGLSYDTANLWRSRLSEYPAIKFAVTKE